jgi:hypothetical protein
MKTECSLLICDITSRFGALWQPQPLFVDEKKANKEYRGVKALLPRQF